jgi:hypothetical protein
MIDSCLEKNQQKKEKKYPLKGLCRINIRICFSLYRAKSGKEKQNCIGQRDKKKRAKDIYPCPSHQRVYETARFIDSRK